MQLKKNYAKWFIKPSFDYMRNTPPEIYNALNDNQRIMFF